VQTVISGTKLNFSDLGERKSKKLWTDYQCKLSSDLFVPNSEYTVLLEDGGLYSRLMQKEIYHHSYDG
jgi:hypothetical protein